MERTLISFNLPNAATIVLMAAGGYVLLLIISQVLQRFMGSVQTTAGSY